MTPIPDSLAAAYSRWASTPGRVQRGFSWRRKSWANRFATSDALRHRGIDLSAAVEEIAAACSKDSGDRVLISRGVVQGLHAPKKLRAGGEQAVVTAFIAAMIWGYGTTGYGPYRTARVLTTDPEAVEHLVEIARIAQDPERGGEIAFAHIAEQRSGGVSYLKYLGPAFGTKFLYFLTAASNDVDTTPVLDAVVRRWFTKHAEVKLYTAWWDPDSYSRYLGLLDEWRAQLPSPAGSGPLQREDVELLIFASERGDADSWLTDDHLIEPAELGIDVLLGALWTEVEQLAASERDDSQEGPELLRQLREWIERDSAVDL